MEKDRVLILQCKRNGWTHLSGELEQYEKVLENEKDAEKMHLQNQLLKIRNDGSNFKSQLKEVKPTPRIIQRLTELMSEVEISINALKEEQQRRLEELLKEERACRQEIRAYEKKIENWSCCVKSDPSGNTTSPPKTKLLDGGLPAEVKALDSFLQRTGGLCGGWDQYDHQAFLTAWTKHSGQPAYRKEAKLQLPAKTLEEMERHEEWHQELLHLQDRKRQAIQRWRARRATERQTGIQSQQGSETRAKGSQNQAQQQNSVASMSLRSTWGNLRVTFGASASGQAKEERRRQLEVKVTIEERHRPAANGIKLFTERDLLKVEAKLQEKQLKEKEEADRQLRIAPNGYLVQVGGQVSRDPSRLTRVTKGWEERLKSIGPSGGGPVTQVFHRAVPTWRQGL
uniref:Coiled-coil domain containing 112 n=1 Tax=Tetraodon nigroviridis TaxID=99883 RepID=H3CC04_TETNG